MRFAAERLNEVMDSIRARRGNEIAEGIECAIVVFVSTTSAIELLEGINHPAAALVAMGLHKARLKTDRICELLGVDEGDWAAVTSAMNADIEDSIRRMK